MSTRSNIGIINRDGSVEMIYCHSDGYPEYNGRILLESYTNEDKIRELMALGDISSLGPEIGKKHDFDAWPRVPGTENWTLAYGRDRGETNIEARLYKNLSVAVEEFDQCYLYLWDCKTNAWIYSESTHKESFHILTPRRCRIKNVPKKQSKSIVKQNVS